MGQVKRYLPGTPSWVDLATNDADGAKAFYTQLFGWEAVDGPAGPDMVYTMLRKEGRTAAGLFAMSPEMQASGMPPTWQTYISVADVEAAAAHAEELGGTVMAGPYDVMESGRMATVRDPVGAVVSLWQPKTHFGCEVVNEPGALTWNELVTRDVDGARAFYEDLFAWQGSVDERGYVSYLNKVGEEEVYAGGIFAMTEDFPPEVPSHWIPYFWVEDAAAARERVIELGGAAVTDLMPAGPGRFCVVQDPQGASFYVFENPSGETGASSDKLP